MAKTYIPSDKKLTDIEKEIIRKCAKCGSEMIPVKKMIEETNFIIKDTGTLYQCKSCNDKTVLISYTSLLVKLLTFFVSIGIVAGMFLNNYFQFLTQVFNSSALHAALTIFVYFIILVIVFGGFINGYFFIKSAKKLLKYPIINSSGYAKVGLSLFITLAYGLIPWVLILIVGFINGRFLHFGREVALFLIMPCFLPIFFSNKFGITRQAAFTATVTYPLIGLIYLFIT
jgi:hypothetical protein